MPTILTDEMKAMPQSVQPTPAAPPLKPSAKRTYQEDEINAFLSQDIIGDFSEHNSTHAPLGFQSTKSDNSIVFFNLTYVDGFPVIFESIKVDHRIQAGGVDFLKAVKKLREKGHISSDVILMVDEMFLQKEASYQSGDYVGEEEEGELYKGIACFMIVGLKQSVPHVIQAIPEVTITGEWLAEKISASLHSLAQTGFTVRGIVTDNHN